MTIRNLHIAFFISVLWSLIISPSLALELRVDRVWKSDNFGHAIVVLINGPSDPDYEGIVVRCAFKNNGRVVSMGSNVLRNVISGNETAKEILTELNGASFDSVTCQIGVKRKM